MKNSLPVGWERVALSKITDGVETVVPEQKPKDFLNYIDIASIDNEKNKIVSPKSLLGADAPSRARQLVKTGDTIFSTVRTYLKNIAFVDDQFDAHVASTGFAVLRPKKNVEPKYLFYWTISDEFLEPLNALQRGISYPAVRNSVVFEQTIPLPPLAEQQRIVAKLDAAFAHLETLKMSLERIPALLKKFRQTVLSHAVTGKLTEDWREEIREETNDEIPASWEIGLLKNIGQVSGGVTLNAKRQQLPLQVDYLRVANVYANELRLDEIKKIGVLQSEFDKTLLQKDDLLIVEGNGSIDQIGRVSIWDNSISPCLHQNHLIRVRVGEKSNARFILFYLLSPIGRNAIKEESSSTTGLHTLNISKIGSLKIPIPPLEEQQEIVTRVEALLAQAEALETRYRALKAGIDRLPGALLAKAFRGELVPQLPTEQPAPVPPPPLPPVPVRWGPGQQQTLDF